MCLIGLGDRTRCIFCYVFKCIFKDVFDVPTKYRFLRHYAKDIGIISIIYLSSFFTWWFNAEAEQFGFETWLGNSTIFGEIDKHHVWTIASQYRFFGRELFLVIIAVNVAMLLAYHRGKFSIRSSYFLAAGLVCQIFSCVIVLLYKQLSSITGLSALRWFYIGRFVFGISIALNSTFSVTYLYKYTFGKPENVRRRTLGSLNTYSMLGDFSGLWLSYMRFLNKIGDLTWLWSLTGGTIALSVAALVEIIVRNCFNHSTNLPTFLEEHPDEERAPEGSGLLQGQNNAIRPTEPKTSKRDFFKALLSSIVLQILVVLCRDVSFLSSDEEFQMWRWNFEDIFKLIGASDDDINEWALATAFCSILFVIASSIYLPHSFEPLKKIRYTTSINTIICVLAIVAKNLRSPRYLGLSAVAHYCFGSLAIESFNELLPSFFRTEKELTIGFALTNLGRAFFVHFFIVLHLRQLEHFFLVILIMIVAQTLMICVIPVIERWLEHRNHIAHYTNIVDIRHKWSCIDEEDELSIIAPITEIKEYEESRILSVVVNDRTGQIQVDLELKLYEDNAKQKEKLRQIVDDYKNSKQIILCLRHGIVRNGVITNTTKPGAFAIFSCKKFIYGDEGHFYVHDHDWAIVTSYVIQL